MSLTNYLGHCANLLLIICFNLNFSLESQVSDAPIVHLGPLEIFAMMFEHRDFKATTMFCMVYTQFLFVTGVIGNMLSIIVLTRPSFRKLTTNIYL